MSSLNITVGGDVATEASARFIDAWRRAEAGEVFEERRLAFQSWEALTRVLTTKRMEILRHIHRHETSSIRALARALGRDYSNVHADIAALSAAGLITTTTSGLRADYDAIETKIAI